jgi:RNA polymerase sigma-70 factor, ECF subfamily
MTGDAPSSAVERVARASYGRLVALLAVRTRDIAAAEDAFGEALVRALAEWPRSGVPANPEGWLVAAAQRIDIDQWRRTVTSAAGAAHYLLLEDERRTSQESLPFPDDRLRLMLACAHPSIGEDMRAPLILQTVLGLDAARIASAFLVAPTAMGQRLSRAKARIRDNGLRLPFSDDEIEERLPPVLDAIYAAFTLGWDLAFTDASRGLDLTEEAIWLGHIVVELAPKESEVLALLALMLFAAARRAARREAYTGAFVPLDRQDVRNWRVDMIDQAEDLLRMAGRQGHFGRFGYEAAIQAVHAARRHSGLTDWVAISRLYNGLVGVSPTVGARLGQVVARVETGDISGAQALFEAIPADACQDHQPYWVAAAHIAACSGQATDARAAWTRAIALTEDDSIRQHLIQCAERGG